jgi:hypothetical protein
MSIVQVFLDPSSPWVITGSVEFDVDSGAHLELPGGTSFPVTPSPVSGDYFVRTDELLLYRYNGSTWDVVGSGGLSESAHKVLRQLIHFIDNGPAEGFTSGAYREITGTVFPTAIIWYDQAGAGKKKIVEKLISWTGAFPSTITWKVYDSSETLLATVTDTITYSGPFETSRLRSIS